MKPADQQTILITGATDGLGRALATELAAAGASVLVHGRDDERGHAAVSQIEAATGNRRLRWLNADFSSLQQVRALSERVRLECDRLDVLVNNAGIGTTVPGDGRRMESHDGHELRFAVNYLSGYLLTRSLLSLLERSAPARVVSVSSAGQAPIDFEDVMLERHYSGVQAYCQSKLAQIMFTFDLAREFPANVLGATWGRGDAAIGRRSRARGCKRCVLRRLAPSRSASPVGRSRVAASPQSAERAVLRTCGLSPHRSRLRDPSPGSEPITARPSANTQRRSR
jgi:NAD(P)-dependent dehydrogenase (short-subunit alcohol dehydrogenase family)